MDKFSRFGSMEVRILVKKIISVKMAGIIKTRSEIMKMFGVLPVPMTEDCPLCQKFGRKNVVIGLLAVLIIAGIAIKFYLAQ